MKNQSKDKLLKLGFLETSSKYVLRIGNYNFNVLKQHVKMDWFYFSIWHITSHWNDNIEYVHDFQNWVSLLTKTELELQE